MDKLFRYSLLFLALALAGALVGFGGAAVWSGKILLWLGITAFLIASAVGSLRRH